MTVPDEPALHRWWVIFHNGSVGAVECEGDREPSLSSPGRFVSEAEYLTARAAIKTAVEENRAAVTAAETTTLRADYEALIALAVPEGTARRLTGYTKETADGHR